MQRTRILARDVKEQTESRRSDELSVTAFEEVDSGEIPAEVFRLPKCRRVSDERMEREAKKMLKRWVK